MYFDDGTNPWVVTENYIKIFHYGNGSKKTSFLNPSLFLIIGIVYISLIETIVY